MYAAQKTLNVLFSVWNMSEMGVGWPVKLELLSMPTGWQQEWAHWRRIEVK